MEVLAPRASKTPPADPDLASRSPKCKVSRGAKGPVSDLVWVKVVKSQSWWPARVTDKRDGCVHVSLFGEGHVGSSSWCSASQVKPFFSPNLGLMARQGRSIAFMLAFQEALKFASKCLQSELTCECIPLEARPRISQGKFEVGISNLAPLEFLNCVRDAALDVSSMNLGESVRLKSWVFALNQGSCDENSGFCQRKSMEELLDKIDLDLSISENEEVLEGCDEASLLDTGLEKEVKSSNMKSRNRNTHNSNIKNKNKKKRDSENENERVVERQNHGAKESTSTKRERKKRDSENENEKVVERENHGASKIEEESTSTKRERKKSKYLSPPYTDAPKTFISSYIAELESEHLNEKKTGEKRGEKRTGEKKGEKKTGDKRARDEDNFVNLEALSAKEILSDLLCTAINPLYLKSKQSERAIRAFFENYRDCTFVEGTSFGSFKYPNVDLVSDHKSKQPDLNIPILKKCDIKKKEERDLKDSDISTPNLNKSIEKVDSCSGSGSGLTIQFEKVIPDKEGNKRKKNSKSGKNKLKETNEKANINGVTMLDFGKGSSEFIEDARTGMLKSDVPKDGNNPTGITNQSRTKQSKRKKNSGDTTGITIPKKRQKKTVPETNRSNYPAALLLDFVKPNPNPENGTGTGTSNGTVLRSREQLLSTFSKFGPLVENETGLHQDSCMARVVFASSTDAVAAYSSSDKLGLFGPPFATCRLHHFPPIVLSPVTPPPAQLVAVQQPVRKPGLVDMRKNLETMIASLKSGSGLGSGVGLGIVKIENGLEANNRPESREKLLGEMQGLLMKVEILLANGATTSSSPLPS